MTEKRFQEIMVGDYDVFCTGSNVLQGLQIIAEFLPLAEIESAENDIIFSVEVYEIVMAGITELDAMKLRKLNWTISRGYLACHV